MDEFEAMTVQTSRARIFLRRAGKGSPVLLLHGFPETHLMWRDVAPLLARQFTVFCADLPGYGSSCAELVGSEPQSKRAMAAHLIEAMRGVGLGRFSVVGHDRGGRVAYRMALDAPTVVERLAVLDILPTEATWQLANAEFALAYWPWSFLAQKEPLPEQALLAAADAVVDAALSGWGSPPGIFPATVRTAYVSALRCTAHAICEDYRAAAGLDRRHDAADLAAGSRIRCPVLALWSARGPLDDWSKDRGGPLGVWREWADDLRGWSVQGGHFFPEEDPRAIAQDLVRFLVGTC